MGVEKISNFPMSVFSVQVRRGSCGVVAEVNIWGQIYFMGLRDFFWDCVSGREIRVLVIEKKFAQISTPPFFCPTDLA